MAMETPKFIAPKNVSILAVSELPTWAFRSPASSSSRIPYLSEYAPIFTLNIFGIYIYTFGNHHLYPLVI